MSEQSRSYYAQRAEEERQAAAEAGDERAAQSHRELADHYLKLADGSGRLREVEATEIRILSKDFRIVP